MKKLKFTALSTVVLMLSTAALAGDGFTPDEAFQTMLKLEGTWTGEAIVVPVGQAKDELIHTHYCAIGNQPSMTFTNTAEQGVIDFQFTKGTNMDVNVDPHAHHSYMKIIDEDTYETRTANWGGGKLTSYRYTTMKRVN
jgi:hypothetical protein